MNHIIQSTTRIFLTLLFLSYSTGLIIAQSSSLPAPVKITSVEGITEYQLANGLKVLIFPDQSKSTMTVNITYLVGSRHEGYGETGMAHLLEHMVFKGSTRHPDIPQELTAHGARPNGTTWYDRTNYYETFTASEENLRWALDLEADRMINSFISKEDLETEFSVVRNEFEIGENSPSSVLEERVMSTAFLWHNYGKSTIGSKEDIEKVPIENLQAFYRKYYQPDNAVLMVAGKLDEAKTISLVNEYFGIIPKPSRVLQPTYTIEPTQDGERMVELQRVGDVQVVACGYHIPAGAHPDFAAISVLSQLLTDEPTGRLYKALVESKKASSMYGYAMGLKDPGFIYFTADVLKEKSLDDAKNTMLNLLDSLTFRPATDEEVDRARTRLLKNLELTYKNSERVGLTLSEYIAKGDWRLWFLYRDNTEKVTTADVNRVADSYFKSSNRTVGIFIPDETPQRAEIPAAPDVNALVKDYKGKAPIDEGEVFDASPANIDGRTKTGTIAGGTEYAFLSKETRGNSVNVSITLRIGSETSLQDKATISQFTSAMLNKGTKNKTREQINDELDELKSSVSISGSGPSVSINILSERDQLSEVLKLLNEILREPSFPQDEFDKMKDENLAGIESQRSEPQAIASQTFSRMTNPYPQGHISYVMSFDEQTEAVKNIQLKDLVSFYQNYYNSTSATLSIVGDFDEALTLNLLTSMFANWKSPVAYERIPSKYFEVNPVFEKIQTPDKTNAMMMAGYNIPLKDDNADYAALVMANYMLGGGFLNSRLATRIRQNEGISYGVGSWISGSALDQSGAFGSYAMYNPDNSERLIAAYQEELDKLLKEGFTTEELKDAVSGYLQGANVSRSQDRNLSGKLSNYLFLNRTMQWDADLEKKISSLTAEEVNAAFARWVEPGKIIYVQAGDFERKKTNPED